MNETKEKPRVDLTDIRRGEFIVVRTAGEIERYEEKPSIRKIEQLVGADCLDTVILKRHPAIVMMVNDTGYNDGKPVNVKATALYHSICKPGTVHPICGDVAIVNDGDFA